MTQRTEPLTVDQMMATISDAIVEIDRARAEVEKLTGVNFALLDALQMLIADFADYPASERPCLAFDRAREAIAKAGGAP